MALLTQRRPLAITFRNESRINLNIAIVTDLGQALRYIDAVGRVGNREIRQESAE